MNFSRRNFLKATAAGALAAAVADNAAVAAVPVVTASDYGVEKKVNMSCRMCAQYCPLVGHVRDGRLVRIESNKNTPYPAVCARGRSAMAALYNADRIKTPLVRTGERGAGQFKAISWNEALDMVASEMRSLREAGLAHTMAYFPRFNTAPEVDDVIIKQFGCYNIFGYGDTCYGSANELGLGSVAGGGKEPRAGVAAFIGDYENARLAVLINRNPAGGLVAFPWGAMFGRGRKNGMKVAIVDPRKPYGTGETDAEWLPVRPGTDPALLVALASEIIRNKYYDEDFLKNYTNADMLVTPDTLMPLELTSPFEASADYLVYDGASKSVRMKSEARSPELMGEYEVDGKKVKTALQMLSDSCAAYTPEEAEKVCGIPSDQIRKLASDLNDTKPRCFLERGYRSARYFHGTKEKQLVAAINAMLGVYGREGGLIAGRNVKMKTPFSPAKSDHETVMDYYKKNVPGFELMNVKHARRIFPRASEDGVYQFNMVLINGQNPVGGSCGGYHTAEAIKKAKTVVAISPYWNETLLLADIILPDCTFMERSEPAYSSYKAAFPVITVNDCAVEPMFDSKNGYWIMTQLAKRIFSAEEYEALLGDFDRGGIDYIRKYQLDHISGMTDAEKASFSSDSLLSSGVWVGRPAPAVPKAKNSPTGKFEVYSIFMAEWNGKLKDASRDGEAAYFTPLFTWADPYWMTKKRELPADEFVPITGFNPLSSFTGAQTRNNVLLKNIGSTMNYDAVFINAAKGSAMGISSGDTVEICNIEKPELIVKAKVVLTETVHPDAMFSYYGVGTGYYTAISSKLATASPMGFNPNHIGNLNFCPVDATAPSHDYIVKIRRAQ